MVRVLYIFWIFNNFNNGLALSLCQQPRSQARWWGCVVALQVAWLGPGRRGLGGKALAGDPGPVQQQRGCGRDTLWVFQFSHLQQQT